VAEQRAGILIQEEPVIPHLPLLLKEMMVVQERILPYLGQLVEAEERVLWEVLGLILAEAETEALALHLQ
jgi:hypothetical protein